MAGVDEAGVGTLLPLDYTIFDSLFLAYRSKTGLIFTLPIWPRSNQKDLALDNQRSIHSLLGNERRH